MVYDLTVPFYEHYLAEGVWEHNSGKTRAGAEWVNDQVRHHGARRVALVGRASADVRDIQITGESGLIECSPPDFVPVWEPSKRRLLWPNGAIATSFSAEEPDQLRGPQADLGWADELGSWKWVADSAGTTAWDNLRMGLRLGPHPKLLVTTTPRRLPVIRDLLDPKAPGVVVTHSTTWDNAANLPESYTNTLRALYQGSALERQELEGLLVEDVDGALWTSRVIEDNRVTVLAEALPYRFVAVDPSVSEKPRDECGIVVVGSSAERRMYERRAYVLEDASMQAPPDLWAREVVRQARKWGCPVVAETNQGGALVKMTLQTVDPSIKVYEVNSRVGKALRAEPVVAATAQARVKFFGYLPQLEDQLVTWNPQMTRDSPDRLDAMVFGVTALLVQPPKGYAAGGASGLVARSTSYARLPSIRPSGSGAGMRSGSRMRP